MIVIDDKELCISRRFGLTVAWSLTKNGETAVFADELEGTLTRLENTIIESGKARIEGNIQYVPYIRNLED